MDFIKDVFKPVLKEIEKEKEFLTDQQIKPNAGFENWLTQRLLTAIPHLKPKVTPSGASGVDIRFPDESTLELKAASDFNPNWLIFDGALKYNSPALFLFNGKDKRKTEELKNRKEVTLLHHEYFSDPGGDRWILGLVKPVPSEVIKFQSVKKPKRKSRPSSRFVDFEELKEYMQKAPTTKITTCMDKALLEGRTIGELLTEMDNYNQKLGSNDFKTFGRIKVHIKYRENHNGWIFKYSGDPNAENTFVRVVGLKI